MNPPNGWDSVRAAEAWNTFVEETVSTKKSSSSGSSSFQSIQGRRPEPVRPEGHFIIRG